MSKQILVRLSAEFTLSQEDNEKIKSKYVAIRDKDGKEICSGELYLSGYETEDGDDCDKDGIPFI